MHIKKRYIHPQLFAIELSHGLMDNTVSGPQSVWDAKETQYCFDDYFEDEEYN